MGILFFYTQRFLMVVAVVISASSICASANAKFIEAVSIDGPGAGAVDQVSDVALASDGKNGGVVYLKQDGGQSHVFFVPVTDGKPGSPKRIDVGQVNTSSMPSVTASNGGKIGVYWVNDMKAYYSVSTDGGATLGSVTRVGTKANVNTLDSDANADGAAYVSLGNNDDVFAYRIENGVSAPVSGEGVLDNDSTKTAGGNATSEDSHVAVTPNGNAYLVWAENNATEAYVRYLTGTAAGAAKRLDSGFPFRGHAEGAKTRQVRVRVNGAGIATVLFNNFVNYGADMPREIARTVTPDGTLGPMVAADGLGDAPSNVDRGVEGSNLVNHVVFDENNAGNGLFVSYRQIPRYLMATQLMNGVFSEPFTQLTTTTVAANDFAVSIGRETEKGFYVWNTDLGGGLKTYVREATPSSFSADVAQISKDDFGVPGHISSAADRFGDGLIAFKQGSDRVAFVALDQPPSTPEFTTVSGSQLEAGVGKIEWNPVREDWGTPSYIVKLNGKQVATTDQLSFMIPSDTVPGNYTVSVEALDREKQSSGTSLLQVVIKPNGLVNPPLLALKSDIQQKGNTLRFQLTNPSGTSAHVRVRLRSKRKFSVRVGKRTRKQILNLGEKRFILGPGKTVTVSVPFSSTARRFLRKYRRISTNVIISAFNTRGQKQTLQKSITLRVGK